MERPTPYTESALEATSRAQANSLRALDNLLGHDWQYFHHAFIQVSLALDWQRLMRSKLDLELLMSLG